MAIRQFNHAYDKLQGILDSQTTPSTTQVTYNNRQGEIRVYIDGYLSRIYEVGAGVGFDNGGAW